MSLGDASTHAQAAGWEGEVGKDQREKRGGQAQQAQQAAPCYAPPDPVKAEGGAAQSPAVSWAGVGSGGRVWGQSDGGESLSTLQRSEGGEGGAA